MFDDKDLFLKADTHWAAKAARGRVDAINANPNLHWLVQVQNGDALLILDFDYAPSFGQIRLRLQQLGVWGDMDIRSITVARKRKRPLLLLPWMRVQAIAAE